ncbi:MAG: PEP-CTERM sorting domain-containing protein [Planctomycetia bacterium]|nr:PEP-CTERM sorting domain-containing protein [Planctomycetia bacterium]
MVAVALLSGSAVEAGLIPAGGLPPPGPPASPGADPAFVFGFISNDGLVHAYGTLNATDNGDSTFTAISGGLVVTGGPSPGTYFLVANPVAPGTNVNYDATLAYDDQLLPGQNPVLTTGGLLFSANGSDSGYEINIFSDGSPSPVLPNGTYTFLDTNGFSTMGEAALPEPSSFLLFGFAALTIGIRYVRRRHKLSIAA